MSRVVGYHPAAMRKMTIAALAFILFIAQVSTCPAAQHRGTANKEKIRFPDLTLYPLNGGQETTLYSFKGKPVLVVFWASWCGPCRMELPELSQLWKELADKGFQVVAINVDTYATAARNFLSRYKIDIPAYRVPYGELRSLGVRSLPTSVLLDRDMFVAQVFMGYSPRIPLIIKGMVMDMLGSGNTKK